MLSLTFAKRIKSARDPKGPARGGRTARIFGPREPGGALDQAGPQGRVDSAALAYQISKEIGALAAALEGRIDAIILGSW